MSNTLVRSLSPSNHFLLGQFYGLYTYYDLGGRMGLIEGDEGEQNAFEKVF